jgi:glycosyltransferase involved in cell wall biosynthesis
MSDGLRRVLFVAYYFPPRGGAGVQRSLKFVKYLRQFGWEPTVLTDAHQRRSGAYDETLLAEVPEDTRIVRVPSREEFFVKLSRFGLGRVAGLSLRPDTQVTWVRPALKAALGLAAERPFDAVYTSIQPWSMGLVGMKLKARLGVPWVCDFRDPWSRSLHLVWPTKLHWEADRALETRYLASADRTVVVTETMRNDMLADNPGLAPERVEVAPNGFDEEDIDAPARADDGKFTIVFSGKFQYDYASEGTAGRAGLRRLGTYCRAGVELDTHSPIYFLRGLARFLEGHPGRRAKTRVVFAGTIGRGNMSLAAELGLSDIVLCPGYLPHAEAVSLVKSADALLLPMFSTADPAERVAYASGKVFEYMAARKPILALTQAGDAKDIAEKSGLGLVVPPRDVDAISRAIGTLFDNWASGSSGFVPDEEFIAAFSRRRIAGKLASILDDVAGKGAAG